MTLEERNKALIDMEDLESLEMLKDRVIYSDEYRELPKEEQRRMFVYCKNHAAHEACKENLKQMRFAIAELYFQNE